MKKLGLRDKMDNILFPENFKFWRNEKKKGWLEKFIEPVVDGIFTGFNKPHMYGVNMPIEIPTDSLNIIALAQLRGQHIDMLLNGNIIYKLIQKSKICHCFMRKKKRSL